MPVNFSIYVSKSLFPDGSRNQRIGQCRWDQNDPVAELIITTNPLYILNCPNEAHRWNYLPPWPFTVWTLPKLVCLLPQKVIKCFWIESFLHQISNWRYFGLGVIWEWNRLQISPSATCSLTFSLRPDSVWPAWKWDVIFVSAASSFLFLLLFLFLLPASSPFFLLLLSHFRRVADISGHLSDDELLVLWVCDLVGRVMFDCSDELSDFFLQMSSVQTARATNYFNEMCGCF